MILVYDDIKEIEPGSDEEQRFFYQTKLIASL